MSRTIELLAPAKNLECGMAAIDHGADAVYIGASRFGARAAAGNSVDDIKALCLYAHMFMAKVYVTVNTIIYDNELEETQELINQLYDAGADAILVQDMGLLNIDLPPIPLHASTQTDNRTPEKVRWLSAKGFSRVVLARELSAIEISKIHKEVPDVELEVFVHGALCVSYSGQCYASQYCFGRSANRGECAQFCRLKFDLEDANGNIIERGRHLLSLKDLCQLDKLETLLESGATSLKIEGRLKDITYVKNVTAAYSNKLNEIIRRRPEAYHRASLGKCEYTFEPNINKTFNRGFTHYFINGREPNMSSPDTPKAIGEYVGNVKNVAHGTITIAGTSSFANGDGLCFFNDKNELQGFRVNRADGNTVFPQKMPAGLKHGKALYRNNDQVFEKQLTGKSAKRKIDIIMQLTETNDGNIILTAKADRISPVSTKEPLDAQKAIKPQTENIRQQLSKLGNTPFECTKIILPQEGITNFVPSSTLTRMRRDITDKLTKSILTCAANARQAATNKSENNFNSKGSNQYPTEKNYLYNVANHMAIKLYKSQGTSTAPAPELKMPKHPLLMQCRYCIRHALGQCLRNGASQQTLPEPLFIRMTDGRRFRLKFDCTKCQMNIYADKQ